MLGYYTKREAMQLVAEAKLEWDDFVLSQNSIGITDGARIWCSTTQIKNFIEK